MTRMTAEELLRRRHADTEWVRKQAEEQAARDQILAESVRAAQPLVCDLHTAGFAVESVWDLVNTKASYTSALPILLDHLQRGYPATVRDGIARALAVPESKFAWTPIVELFKNEREEQVKDGLAVAIANISDDESIEELVALVRNPAHGTSRVLLLSALERSASPSARHALRELSNDRDLKKEIKFILRRMGKRRAP